LGHKVHPTGFRLGVVKGWQSRWYAERDYKDLVSEDRLLRETIQKELANASVSRIEIERAATNQVSVTIHTAKPGIVIGKSGEKVDKLRAELERKTKKRVRLNIVEIRQPELDAYLVGRSIAEQLEKRISFRRAMKQAVQKTMRANAKGIRIVVGGRLGGAEIARSEKEVEGKIPLHTLRADIDYGLAEAHTTFGVIGIKVWIYKGDILPDKRREGGEAQQEVATPFAPRERGEGGDRRGDRRGGRGERGTRGQGERSQVGERQPRGERPARVQGERPPRAPGERVQGERPPRAPGERVQRGERGQGERAQGGERPARTPRSQGERPARAGRTGRPAEQAAAAPETQAVSESQVPAVQGVQETKVTQAPETQAASENQVPAVQDVQETEVTQAPTPPSPAPGDGDGATESE
jgi:small subunit ribosomal protein S3